MLPRHHIICSNTLLILKIISLVLGNTCAFLFFFFTFFVHAFLRFFVTVFYEKIFIFKKNNKTYVIRMFTRVYNKLLKTHIKEICIISIVACCSICILTSFMFSKKNTRKWYEMPQITYFTLYY